MTTPRVTVPVDEQVIKRLQEEADHPGLGDSVMVFGPDLRALLRAYRSLSAAPAPEGGAVKKACVDFQEAIDDFEAEVADVMAEGSERADLWDREIMVNIDALKTVMNAALATSEDAQPVGWLRAVDEEMVCAHLGVADAEDSFETAKKKLASLIQWNIAVATDPSVGGHPAPDALRVAVEALDEMADTDPDEGTSWFHDRANKARADIAALQAEQGAK